MAIDFPNAPTVGQIFPTSGPGQQWQWDGTKWVAYNVGSGGATVIISDTAPAGPTTGTLWFDSLGTQMYIYESDGNSSQWVPVVNQGGALTLAAATNVGRNLLHNPLFNVQQRGIGPWAGNGYTADRWTLYRVNDTDNANLIAFSDAARVQIGDEAARNQIGISVTGSATAGSQSILSQLVEGVGRLSGKTVTASFYGVGSTALRLGVSIDQNFGSGGSPSTRINGAGQSVSLTTTWARYSLTFTIPSASGKTYGTNSDDATSLNLWFSAASDSATRSGGVGVQTGTFYLWGVQLEIGSQATPLEKPDPQQDLAKCQRFFQSGQLGQQSYAATGITVGASFVFPVTMRATPIITPTSNANGNIGTPTNAANPIFVQWNGVCASTGQCTLNQLFTASADL